MPRTTINYKGGMLFQSKLGNHSLLADVPPAMGGNDRGPTPPDLFIASLGTYVAALVVQYCERNDMDTCDMTVDVEFKKTDQPTRLTDIVVTISMPHASCHDREGTIRRVAEHCPVHETMTNLSEVKVVLVDQAQVPALQDQSG